MARKHKQGEERLSICNEPTGSRSERPDVGGGLNVEQDFFMQEVHADSPPTRGCMRPHAFANGHDIPS